MTEIHQILLKRVEKVRQSYTDFLNNPFREETPHKLRVNTRKLRGILNILKKAMYKEDYDKLNEELRDIALLISDLREIDVLSGLCAGRAKDIPEVSEHLQEMFFYLNKERHNEMEKALDRVKQENAGRTIDRMKSKVESLEFKKKYSDEADLKNFISERLKKKRQKLIDKYESIDVENYEEVHELRKAAKKLRFGARYLGKLAELDYKTISKEAKKIQDEFGEITDRHVNMKMLEEYADSVDDKELQKLFLEMRNLEKEE